MGDDGEPESLMVLEFQVKGGNAWAQAVAFGVSREPATLCVLCVWRERALRAPRPDTIGVEWKLR